MQKNKAIRYLLISVWVGLFMVGEAQVGAQTRPTVFLYEQADVTGRDIVLGSIATIKSADEELTAKLAAVVVAPAALPGRSQRVTVGHIDTRLRQAGIDPRSLEFSGAPRVEVYTNTASEASVDRESVLEEIHPAPPVSVTPAVNTYTVVVATRNLARHHVLTQADLRLEERSGRVPATRTKVEDFLGKRVIRTVSYGSELNANLVEVPPLVETGKRVNIIAEMGNVRVSAPGRALATGGFGEIIRVENLTTRQIVQAQIVSSDVVRVETGGGVGN